MNVCTYSEAKRNLGLLLEEALREGETRIKRKDGKIFVIRPESHTKSPLAVEGMDLGITTDEIVQFIHEGRRTFEQ